MTTAQKIVQLGSPSTRQSPRTKAQMLLTAEESDSEQEELQEEFRVTPVYISPRAEDAPDVVIPKGAQYDIPLPPIDVRVHEDGDFLGYAPTIKFTDYNLGDSKTYPHYRQDQYLLVQRNPRT